MILNVVMISTKQSELEKINDVMQEMYSYNTMFTASVITNYSCEFEYANLKVISSTLTLKREILNDVLNNATSDVLILDLKYDLSILKDVIKTTFENKCDYIYFYGKRNKFVKFIDAMDAKFFNFYLNLRRKAKYLSNLNTLTYISFRIIKLMRTCDEDYSYLQNCEAFKDYDTIYHEIDVQKKFQVKNIMFPLLTLFNISLVVVLLINMIKYFKTTNTIINMVITCFFVFILLFGYSFLIYYNVKYKKLLKRGNDE